VVKDFSTPPDTGFRVFKLATSNIKEWEPDRKNLSGSLEESVDHLKTDRTEQDILFELLLKLGLDLCVPMEGKRMVDGSWSRVDGKNASAGAGLVVHAIGGGVLFACLSGPIGRDDAEPLALGIVAWRQELDPAGEVTCVFRDSAFADDVAKTNLVCILEQNGITNVRSI
jgi:adenine-specific DNA-methyltransferase